ncbi:PREDICTED: transcription factor bHLH18 isoform X2 [Tarenaya hassleriana]|nr:PREDICTED: transcription factor bHLH18 isoform X2 [Tarenaya hassleriana]
MDLPSTKWFSELEMEEYNIIQLYHMNPLVGDDTTLPQSIDIAEYFDGSSYELIEEKPSNALKTHHIQPKILSSPPQKRQPSTQILSFENGGFDTNDLSNYPIFIPKEAEIRKLEVETDQSRYGRRGTKRAHQSTRIQPHGQDHVLAERKRREKLTQRFVALSAMVPGLKKMDKASVLGDAIKHIKHLQDRVKEFEEEKKERSMESVALIKKSRLVLDEEDDKSDSSNSALPEIEVRVSGKDAMIKILCEKQKGHATKILSEIEKLHLCILNNNILPFGPTLDITVIARKERDFDMTTVDVVKNLRLAFSKFM